MRFIIFRGVGLSFSGCGMAFVQIKDMPRMAQYLDLYCRSPEFTVMPPGKYPAGGLQSGCTANSTGAQYKYAHVYIYGTALRYFSKFF